MDLRDIECFVAIAETGSITAASTRLNRVQSGISTRLKNLEETLGKNLFERQGKRLAISAAGERFLVAARDLLQQAENAKGLLQEPTPGGRFRIGSMECTAAVHLPSVLSQYHKRYPTVQLELKTLPSFQAVTAVENGLLDAAFVSADACVETLSRKTLWKDELVLVSAADHPPIRVPEDLNNASLLVFPSGCAYRLRAERWAQGDKPLVRFEIGSYHALLSCAAAGAGVGLVPRALLRTYPDRKYLRIHKLPAAVAQDKTCLVWNNGRLHPNLTALLAIV